MNGQLPGQQAAQRVSASLRKMKLSDTEVAKMLLRLDMAIQEEVGQELLDSLPEDKRKEIEKGMDEGKDPREFAHFFNVPQDEMQRRLEEKCNKIADELEELLKKAEEGDKQIKEEISKRFLAKTQSQQNST